MQPVVAIGLMSGTSVDGIDAALVRIDGPRNFELISFLTQNFTPTQRDYILNLCRPESATVEDICYGNFELGKLFAEAAQAVAKKAGIPLSEVDFIGSHGQTVYHIPGHSTLQIGEPAVIANLTGVVTVADFRPADISRGGQGAPLVPYFDQLFFGESQNLAIQNIGGIGNVTIVGPDAGKLPAMAFDTGPGNMIIDGVVELMSAGQQSYDRDGEIAAAGSVDQALLGKLMEVDYFTTKPPKSTGRELFGRQFAADLVATTNLSMADLVATVTAFTAKSIEDQYRRFVFPYCQLEAVVVGGGGSYNPELLRMLSEYLNIPVRTHEDYGIPSDAKEAIAFAYLAQATLARKTNNVPAATGASAPVVLGKICYPSES